MDEALLISFQQSVQRFQEILHEPESAITRDAAIQRFEFVEELSWKCIQKFLRDEQIICRSPKECLREAFTFGLVEEDARWFALMEDRNLTVHTYHEPTAKEVYARLPSYLPLFENLLARLQEEITKAR